ncbi:MAG TPA: hypothetical protein VMT37_15905 [Solirubrobacterales bacterium]|nr:hypothetical protein [Solirubrobacterales bacterium]
MRVFSRVLLGLFVLVLGVGALGATAFAAPTARGGGGGLSVKINGKSQAGYLKKKAIFVKVHSSKPRKVKVSGTSSTFDAGSKQLTGKVVVRFRRAGTKTVKLPLLRGTIKNVKSCTARTIKVHAGGAKAQVEMTRTSHECRLPSIDMSQAENCDFIANPGNALCMLPFPDNYYTTTSSSSETGRQINFQTAGMPANAFEEHIEAAPYNASNGFSQGAVILVKIPGIESVGDVSAMGATPINKLASYTQKNTPVVVIDASTGKRWPIWAEIDSTAKEPSKRVLEIHPAVNFDAGTRYIVALRNVKGANGKKIEAPAGFRYYRDEMPTKQGRINAQRKRFKSIFSTLKKAGIRRESLYLAWDFTTASDMNNARRLLAIRDNAFAQLGDTNLADGIVQGTSPSFEVTKQEKVGAFKFVEGTVKVPCYLFPSCAPGGTFKLGAGEAPMQNGTYDANFVCDIPEAALTTPGRPSLYGHGLFGSASEVKSSPQLALAEGHNIVFCATDEIGMSEQDEVNTLGILHNLSRFPQLADRLQQGELNELYLGRAMINKEGFGTNAAFQNGSAESVIDSSRLYYNGNSQGGIEGGALTAVAPDFTRASLGVPAMNYSVLLPRSVDFDQFASFLYPSYPNETARPLALDLIQMLWDRGEPNGYAHRMTTNPLPDTPVHQVVMNVALGDHQVTDYQADVEARTIGASAHTPALYSGRWPNTEYLWNVPSISSYPFSGSAIYYWDIGPIRPGSEAGKTIGVEPPPYENLPNRLGEDPHGAPRAAKAEQQLVSDFFNGAILSTDNCGGGPCYAGSFTGP